jgi:hypothetical protein
MAMDRIVLGQHANTSIGAGLYVSAPGANVMHPEHAQFGNLMFDSNEPHSTLNIIETGTFKITCSRKAISARGETIGTRPNDTQELFLDGATGHSNAHTFPYDTERPSNLTTVANWDEAKTLGYHNKSFGKKAKSKQSNYLDTGSHTITIASPLSNGEIPEVALRFAVGNSSGHFHPWYANTVATGNKGDWSDIDYASGNTQQIVHMDSNWMRLKWGGLGAEEYRGIQNEYNYDSLLSFFGDSTAAAANLGFSSSADMELKLKNSKLLSLAINNSQGVVGLIPYVNATSIHVDAYMSPTHAGLRQPVDRTFEKNKGRQKGVGFNAIDDYAHINFPMEHHPHTSGLTDAQISEDLNAKKFKHLPGIPPPGNIYRDDGGDFDNEDHGKRDMYGWGGHPTEFFVNPFSNANLTFYTHMQPPYVPNKGTTEVSGNTFTGHYIPIGYANEPSDGVNQVWGPDWKPNATSGENETQWNKGTAGTPSRSVFSGAGVKWPPGHPHADYLDHRDWTGSMGLAGAGSKEAMAVDDVYDTFYCSYVVYSTGSVPPPEASLHPGSSSSLPNAGRAAATSSLWDSYLGPVTSFAKGESNPALTTNVIFPDDFVGTVGDPATDPFASHRDGLGKIYSNFHFNLDLDEGDNYGSDKFSTTTGKPLPVFVLDFGEDKWNYKNSKTVSIIINNSARIVGGAGAGGMGVRDVVVTSKSGDVSGGGFGGGGGGAGGGTGRNPQEATPSSYLGYEGTGFHGGGWPHDDPALSQSGPNIRAQPGTDGSRWDVGGYGGAKAQQESSININNSTYIVHNLLYGSGSDGGDIFEVKHPAGVQPIIKINNSDVGIIVSGGGGGAGGHEVSGGSGGSWGAHGQGTSGSTAHEGGNPGYIVTSANSTYTRPVHIVNINNGIVHGRNPQILSHDTSNTSGGIAGGWYVTGNVSSYYGTTSPAPPYVPDIDVPDLPDGL